MRLYMFTAFAALALAGCSGSDDPSSGPGPDAGPGPVDSVDGPVSISGAVQKGPFILGSSVTVTPVDNAPAARTETKNDLGEFEATVEEPGFATIEATGFHFNEAIGDLSSAPITLRAYYEIGNGEPLVYVNIITSLTYQRVSRLVKEGADGRSAIVQAEGELRESLGLGEAAADKAGAELTLTGGDSDENAYLFAVSGLFAQAAYLDAIHQSKCGGGCVEAKLQELLNTTSSAFAQSGEVGGDVLTRLQAARLSIRNSAMEQALADRFEQTGSSAEVPDLDRVIPWEVPAAVTQCAKNVLPGVPEPCALAACGLNARPVTKDAIAEVALWQREMTADYCGAQCWEVVRCALDRCVEMYESGAHGIDQMCAAAQCNAESAAGSGVPYAAVIEHVFYSADGGECD